MASPKIVVVNKPNTGVAAAQTTHSTGDSTFVNGEGDLVVLDQSCAVLAIYPKGTWGSVRSGANV